MQRQQWIFVLVLTAFILAMTVAIVMIPGRDHQTRDYEWRTQHEKYPAGDRD